jgi:hypothetical protein
VKKLILLQILYAVLVIPSLAARNPHPIRGLKWGLLMMVLFNLWYVFAVLVIWPTLED